MFAGVGLGADSGVEEGVDQAAGCGDQSQQGDAGEEGSLGDEKGHAAVAHFGAGLVIVDEPIRHDAR